jgi:hypothetical protein
MLITSPSPLPDQIPPIPPPGSGGGEGGEFGEDPNLKKIRDKLAAQPLPLRLLASMRAEERLYAPVMGGAVTVDDVLAAIDDAALTLGPELGNLDPDKQGLASLERYVAGCIKRARRDRRELRTATLPASRPSPPSAPASEPSPEVAEALCAFRDLYVSAGGYERVIMADDDARHIADALVETAKQATGNKSAIDVMCSAAKAYFEDAYYGSQGHSLKRFAIVLRTEPTRLLGKKRRDPNAFDPFAFTKNPLEARDEDCVPMPEDCRVMFEKLKGKLSASKVTVDES